MVDEHAWQVMQLPVLVRDLVVSAIDQRYPKLRNQLTIANQSK